MSHAKLRILRLIYMAGAALLAALIVGGCSALGGGDAADEIDKEPGPTPRPTERPEEPEPTPRPTERPEEPEDVVNVVPTPLPTEDVGEEALSGAKEDLEETWNNYVRDIIAEQVAERQQKLDLLQRYENPDITAQNLAGLVSDIDLVEDRTEFNVASGSRVATATTDFDVRLTFLNGDTDTRTCQYFVSLEQDQEDGLWYVINPAPLQIFASCFP